MNANEPVATRKALHAVAELVMAGPQYRRSGTIRLGVTPGGFATVAEPVLRVEGVVLVAGETRVELNGRTLRELGEVTGSGAGAPEGLYHDGSGGAPDDVVVVDAEAAGVLAEALGRGDAALRAFAPGVTPVLWPEHFDLGISVDEVNYGISLGDGHLDEPYAYVGPWQPREGEFWNAPFGAARPLSEVDDLAAFFAEGRRLASG
ncbi:hypothetical protein ABGB17_30460 [Sphaerisporangium sp. B11E5]|uniref:hypothetical protein n=1 Tax=Sphaerisporangium sp. B11E5 TaxID=3153563 RepID=UPI00325DD527